MVSVHQISRWEVVQEGWLEAADKPGPACSVVVLCLDVSWGIVSYLQLHLEDIDPT